MSYLCMMRPAYWTEQHFFHGAIDWSMVITRNLDHQKNTLHESPCHPLPQRDQKREERGRLVMLRE